MGIGLVVIIIITGILKIFNVIYNKSLKNQDKQLEINLLPDKVSYDTYIEIYNNQMRGIV